MSYYNETESNSIKKHSKNIGIERLLENTHIIIKRTNSSLSFVDKERICNKKKEMNKEYNKKRNNVSFLDRQFSMISKLPSYNYDTEINKKMPLRSIDLQKSNNYIPSIEEQQKMSQNSKNQYKYGIKGLYNPQLDFDLYTHK